MDQDRTVFHVKKIDRKTGSQSILLQSENGPCALIAIVNILVLRDSPMAACVNSHLESGSIDEATVLAKLGETTTNSENCNSDNIEALFEFLPKLSQGLDVNPKFDGSFAHSIELDVFQAFDIKLLHGWVLGDLECEELGIDVQEREKLAHISYEQLCAIQFSDEPNEKLGKFINKYSTQMTPSGYIKLGQEIKPGELAVLFWNNHFSTLLNYNNRLYTLVTDLGFQRKPEVAWEEVDVTGAGSFVDGEFKPSDEQETRSEALAQKLASENAPRTSGSANRSDNKRATKSSDNFKSKKDNATKSARSKTRKSSDKSDKKCIIS